MVIRRKELKDCRVWREILVESWSNNLRGVVSDRFLRLFAEAKEGRIANDIANFKSNDDEWVLEDDGKVLGVMKLAVSEHKGYEGYPELQVLYLYSYAKGKGYGRALIEKAKDLFKNRGHKQFVLGCLDGNKSNEFYRHMGGVFIRQEPWTVFGETYKNNLYLFNI